MAPPSDKPPPRDPDTLSEHATVVRAPPPNDSLKDDPTERMQRGEVSTAPTVIHTPTAAHPAGIDTSAVALSASTFEQRYEFRYVLGAGGMGEIRLCKDKLVGREVALKVLRPEAASAPGAAERFVREARVQGQLEHPAIVPVHDLGVTPGGEIYFTMKRVRGKTLDFVLRLLAAGDRESGARYSRRKLLSAFTSVCLAVDFAHALGVLHRDLKPANIMLGDFGEVSVLDWGLAKVDGVAEDPRGTASRASLDLERPSQATAHGALLGTPGYMAPEQARGDVETLEARADVYSLGAILFEMVALAPLHPGPGVAAMLESTLAGADARPSARGRTDVPPEIEAICVRATALDPAERFPTARALCDAVERFLDGDRDLQLRKDLATLHAEAARAHLERAERDDAHAAGARTDALREAGRALAIDPDNADAMAAMAALLMNVPDRAPPEAEAALEESESSARRAAARTMSLRFIVWGAMIPMAMAMGIRQWPLALGIIAMVIVCAAAAFWVSRRGSGSEAGTIALLLATSTTIAAMSSLFGPFILVPALSATNTMFFAGQLDGRARRNAILVGTSAVILPFAFDLLGIFPSAYRFRDGVVELVPRVASLPVGATTATLLVTSVALVVTPALMAGRMRDSLRAAERRLFLQAWHLSQLVPEQARDRVGWKKILRATRRGPRG